MNKKIVLKYAPHALVLEILDAALIIAVLSVTANLYPDARAAGGGESLLFYPILSVYVYLVLTGAGIIARRFPYEGGANAAVGAVLEMVLCLKAVFLIFALSGTYYGMLSLDMPVWASFVMPVGFGVTLVYYIIIIRRQYLAKRREDEI